MKRKTIAVCVTGYNWEYETNVVNAMKDRCFELDINLLVFASLIKKPELSSGRVLHESIISGEVEIFNLINYELVDGVVILGDSIISEEVIYSISAKAKKHGIPVVNINDPDHKLQKNIILSDSRAMEFVMRHLVEDHGLRRINFIGGFPGNLQTEERLGAYKKILTEHNIPIEEERIAYGEFWKKATECTEQFLAADELPEAIVCASDTMAFFCMDCIKAHGYRIPEDIVVTGFDGVADCEVYQPSLTTVRRAFRNAGIAAVDILKNTWDGINVPDVVEIDSVLVQNHSCGCFAADFEEAGDFHTKRYGFRNKAMEINYYILEANTNFPNAKNSRELYNEATKARYYFSLNKLFLCICADIEDGNHTFNSDENLSYRGLDSTMISMIKEDDVPIGTRFPASKLVPVDILNGEKARFFAFSPIYFKNKSLGYIAYEPKKMQGAGDFFATWLVTISNNAGIFYMKNELEDVVDKLENLYIRDPLTGLYNRRGMEKLGKRLLEQVTANNGNLTIICVDIDGLKPINDNYGHEAGDNAIIQTANAIKAAVPRGSVCTRTGGDEYCVMLSSNSDEETAEYLRDIDDFLSEYNDGSRLPYKVGCSCGFCSLSAESIDSVDSMIKIADANMYQQKAAKKANRI
ncbi:MAG: GGDEF domain-containing protein [Oscillospiraceae bacterium]|nr:GGDEF domain-containing protein [Oscillospiraceae bacterium]